MMSVEEKTAIDCLVEGSMQNVSEGTAQQIAMHGK
jgi:hypothetical protein